VVIFSEEGRVREAVYEEYATDDGDNNYDEFDWKGRMGVSDNEEEHWKNLKVSL
jgi:hypothetical protein